MTDLFKLPKLGFGLMRLPMRDDKIDYDTLNDMVDETMKHGFAYFDTAYSYHGGESESAAKQSIVSRYPRESFFLADKLPAWEMHCPEDASRLFDEQLERTGAGYFDFYLLHSIEENHLKTYDKYDCWNWAREMKAKGLIRHFGFSFHDTPELLDKVLTEHPEVEFVQLQINYVDWDNLIVHSGGCYEVARKHNIPIVVMEPVKGGTLASMQPKWETKLKSAAPGNSIASWAMRFCLSLEGIATILSGMSTPEQLRDNIATVRNFIPFTEMEKACLAEVTKEFLAAPTVACTSCGYCVEGCPAKINIPGVINAYNTVLTYGDHDRPHFYYRGLVSAGGRAGSCNQCGYCEEICTQRLNVIDVMKKASGIFDGEGACP